MGVAAGAAAGGVVGAIASGLSGLVDTGVNWYLTEKTNKQNEALMRESWSREDNAVQRRVADLKAAGLSPTLAAGQAAASSGPISVKAPKLDTSSAIQNVLSTASAVKALKNMDLQNDNLEKQGEILDLNKAYYGYPDWAVAGIRMFGLEEFKDMLRSVGGKLFGLGDFGTPSVPVPVNYPTIGAPLSRPKLKTDLSMADGKAKFDPMLGPSKPSLDDDKSVPTPSDVGNSESFDLQNQTLKIHHDELYDELSSFARGQAKPLTLDGVYSRYVQELRKEGFEKDKAMGIVSSWINKIMDDLGYSYDKNDKMWFYDH